MLASARYIQAGSSISELLEKIYAAVDTFSILKFTFVQKPGTRYTYNTAVIAITITGSYCLLFHF